MEVLTKEECKRILFQCGIKFGVSPRLISERLLSDQDKDDMLKGVLPIALLEQTVEVWRDNGMPDYAHGKTESYAAEKRRIKYAESQEKRALGYRGAFVDYRVMD